MSRKSGAIQSTHRLYAWVKRYSKPQEQRAQEEDQQAELRRLRAELKRATEELHIPAHRDRPFRLNVTACSGLS